MARLAVVLPRAPGHVPQHASHRFKLRRAKMGQEMTDGVAAVKGRGKPLPPKGPMRCVWEAVWASGQLCVQGHYSPHDVDWAGWPMHSGTCLISPRCRWMKPQHVAGVCSDEERQARWPGPWRWPWREKQDARHAAVPLRRGVHAMSWRGRGVKSEVELVIRRGHFLASSSTSPPPHRHTHAHTPSHHGRKRSQRGMEAPPERIQPSDDQVRRQRRPWRTAQGPVWRHRRTGAGGRRHLAGQQCALQRYVATRIEEDAQENEAGR